MTDEETLSPEEIDALLDGPGMAEWRKQRKAIQEKREQGIYVEIADTREFRGLHPDTIIAKISNRRRSKLSPEDKLKAEERRKREHEWAEERGTAIKNENDEETVGT